VSHLLLRHGRGETVVSIAVVCRGVGVSYLYCCGMARVDLSYLLWDGGGSGLHVGSREILPITYIILTTATSKVVLFSFCTSGVNPPLRGVGKGGGVTKPLLDSCTVIGGKG
jgi:hypothetical protein